MHALIRGLAALSCGFACAAVLHWLASFPKDREELIYSSLILLLSIFNSVAAHDSSHIRSKVLVTALIDAISAARRGN